MPAAPDSAAFLRSAYRRLSPLGPLGLRGEACLHLHKPFLDCRRCADACPRGCLRLTAGGIDFDASACTGCGQCAAACPSEALAADGFACDDTTTGSALRIACRRAAVAPGDASWRVPCLGGLDTATLVALAARRQAALRLLDDAGCTTCPNARNHENPLRPRLPLAHALLRSAALPEAWLPVIETPLPNGNQPAARRETASTPGGRRGFFSGLGRTATATVIRKAGAAEAELDLAALPRQPREAIPYQRGHRLLRTLARLAEQRGGGGAADEWRAEVTVADACQAHGACARLCPTGALALEHGEATSRLSFDPWLCIDCAACRTACPGQALNYKPPAWRPPLGGRRQVIREVGEHECASCGARFPADSGDLCGPCHKAQALASAGFGLFRGLREATPRVIGPPNVPTRFSN